MFGVAGGTPGLTDGITDNGNNGVIGHASFTRTIVIDDIAEPQRALLHSQKLPNRKFNLGRFDFRASRTIFRPGPSLRALSVLDLVNQIQAQKEAGLQVGGA